MKRQFERLGISTNIFIEANLRTVKHFIFYISVALSLMVNFHVRNTDGMQPVMERK